MGTGSSQISSASTKRFGGVTPLAKSAWDTSEASEAATPSRWDSATPVIGSRKNRWDETPQRIGPDATPGGSEKKVRSRWDETPVMLGGATPVVGATPYGGIDMMTPSHLSALTPEQLQELRFQRDVDDRNRPWVDEELDALFPPEGYEILEPPASYKVAQTTYDAVM